MYIDPNYSHYLKLNLKELVELEMRLYLFENYKFKGATRWRDDYRKRQEKGVDPLTPALLDNLNKWFTRNSVPEVDFQTDGSYLRVKSMKERSDIYSMIRVNVRQHYKDLEQLVLDLEQDVVPAALYSDIYPTLPQDIAADDSSSKEELLRMYLEMKANLSECEDMLIKSLDLVPDEKLPELFAERLAKYFKM